MPAQTCATYREYLEPRYLDEFDEWAKTYVNPFDDLRGPRLRPQLQQRPPHRRARGRRRRGRGAVPQHHPAVLPVGEPRGAATVAGGVRAAVGRAEGAQPLDGRLLRGGPGPARRHRADHAERRRRRRRRDPLGQGRRPHRRDPAARRPARRAGAAAALPPTTSRSGRRARTSTSSINHHGGGAVAERPHHGPDRRRHLPHRAGAGTRTGRCGT